MPIDLGTLDQTHHGGGTLTCPQLVDGLFEDDIAP
jgi:hypothetical protein